MNDRFALPNDPAAISGWADDFAARYGVLPIGGGEAAAAAPPAVAAPPAAPAAPAAVPDPAPAAAAPAAPPAPVAPEAPAQAGAPADPAAQVPGQAPAADDTPDWARRLLDGMDQLQQPPQQVDPLAAELFGIGQPPAPEPAQQGHPQQGTPQAPGQQQPGAVPGQPQAPAADPTEEAVLRLIDERASAVAAQQLREQVVPIFQQQESLRRRSEAQALLDDYPELKDPKRLNEVVNQAKAWATETLGDPAKAGEPGYLATVLLAMKGMEFTRQGQQPPAPGNQGEVPIEGAGGGNPGGAVPEQTELAQAIVDAGPGGGLNPLWV